MCGAILEAVSSTRQGCLLQPLNGHRKVSEQLARCAWPGRLNSLMAYPLFSQATALSFSDRLIPVRSQPAFFVNSDAAIATQSAQTRKILTQNPMADGVGCNRAAAHLLEPRHTKPVRG